MSDPARKRTPRQKAGGKKEARRRVPWGTLTRQQVVQAAVDAIRDGRYEQMTIRSLADDLGVAPMSLYRHVRDKDDLLDEVTDQFLAKTWRPRGSSADWRTWTLDAAKRLRDLLVTEPATLHCYLRHPVVSPAAMLRMKSMLEVLGEAGFDEVAARRAYAAIHTYTVGFAALEASRVRWASSERPNPAYADRIQKELASFTTSEQFSDGLEYLLEGIERRSTGE